MRIEKFPEKEKWGDILSRPVQDMEKIEQQVRPILDAVKLEGDIALKKFSLKFDRVKPDDFKVSENEIKQSAKQVDSALKEAIKKAIENISRFHRSQLSQVIKIETAPGVMCWRKDVPVEKVGLYIPGGTAPLFSTVLMLGIPAQIAGCKQVVLCSPPNREGKIHPAVLYAAGQVGIKSVFKIGGAQAIAALAYGTESLPKVDKIFGPGNQFVTAAKLLVSKMGVAIDMPAGPSEVLVIADKNANAGFIAADLLSQAEHGVDSQVVFITNDATLLDAVSDQVKRQLENLPRREIADKALKNSLLILTDNLETAMAMSNYYAPEHLILMVENSGKYAGKIVNAGSVFLGPYSPEAAGDYASGTNHVLPTNGFAKNYSGVSVESFTKKISFQEISRAGLKNIGPAIETMAEAEALFAHKNAVSIRLGKIVE
jgi:histidinol dehydrogenase